MALCASLHSAKPVTPLEQSIRFKGTFSARLRAMPSGFWAVVIVTEINPFWAILSVVAAIVVGLISFNWFFKDGDESTRSLQHFAERETEWWMTKFGVWLAFSLGSGAAAYVGLPLLWERLLSGL